MKALYILILSMFSLGIRAQQVLTLQECRTKALESNKQLNSANIKLEEMGYQVNAYRANYFPKIDLNIADIFDTGKDRISLDGANMPLFSYLDKFASLIQSDPAFSQLGITVDGGPTSLGLDYSLNNLFVGNVTLAQPIFMGGKITAAYRMAKIGKQMAAQNIKLTENQVLVSVDEAYSLAVRAKELGEVAKAYRNLLLELQKNVDAAVKHGVKLRNDQLKVQVKLNEAELALTRAENGYRLATMNLCHAIGLPLTQKIEVDASSVQLDTAEPVLSDVFDITSRPEFEILQGKTALAKQNVNLTRSDFLPNMALMASFGYINGGKLKADITTPFTPTHGVLDNKILNSWSGTFGVTLKVPLVRFGEGVNKMRAAKAELRIAELEQSNLNEMMTLELAQATNDYNERITEVNIMHKSVEQAEENMKLSKAAYEVGTEPLSDYLEAQALWQQAKAAEVESRCQLFISKTKYDKARGK